VFARLQRFPMRYFDRNPVGKIVSRVTTDVDVLSEMFAAGAMTIALDGLKLIGIVALMLWIDWRLALASLALLPPMVFAIDFFRRMARRTYREIRERIARINGYLQEAISGMSVIALSAREERCFEEFRQLNADHRDSNQLSNRLEAALFSMVEAVSTVSVAVMLFRAAGLRPGPLEVGTVWAFIQYINQFFVPIRDFSAKYAVMQSSMTAAERIFALLDEPVEPSPAVPAPPPPPRGEIVFDRVWFAYRGEDWVLRDVSFRIEPGERVAIVGATGSGKTTIIKLVDRLYDVQRGRILVDGVEAREWDLHALRRRTAVVLQDVFLFNGSVADNITLGRRDIPRERIEVAARHVNADGFIRRMGGYDAEVRERGSNLSGGQRQLLAFARALAHDPTILILDEATSSVDPETE
jgi:ATP-binding cassette, subfamily B, multidrug efflux pump